MVKVWIKNQQRQMRIDLRLIKRIATEILAALELPGSELSILLLDDARITRLNQQYLGRNRPTDVIAFPLGDTPGVGRRPWLLGDVVISVETAARQSARYSRTPCEEIAGLLIHGILHLIGYDHALSATAARRMRAKEKTLLERLLNDPAINAGLVQA